MEKLILELVEGKKYGLVGKHLSEMNPADIAPIFEELPQNERTVVFRILPKETAAEVFVELDSDMQQFLIEAFSDSELRAVMDELYMDDTVDIIDEMPANVVKRILKQTDVNTRKTINQLLEYPDNSAGSIMTTEFISIKKDMTVEEAFKRIRRSGVDAADIYTCYVTDAVRHLIGIISVRELLLSPSDKLISDIMDDNVIFANTLDDRETVAAMFEKYDILALPIVDKESRLIGVVTVDDAITVMQQEASEDIEKMAAILPSEKSYLKTGIFETFRSRIPWLLFLMISATFTGAVISAYEDKLTIFPALISFIPMLMGTGGNSGSQASVTVIRALSLGDIRFKDILRVLYKELKVSLLCGAALCLVNFLKLYILDYLIMHNLDTGYAIAEMMVVCITLFFTVVVAKLVGSMMPVLAKRIGLDPAVMASPLVTTVLDAVSLFIYFSVAGMFLKI